MNNRFYPSRVIIIQNIYSKLANPEVKLNYKKSQFKKFIKDVTEGTLEREELINKTIIDHLSNDIDLKKSEKTPSYWFIKALYICHKGRRGGSSFSKDLFKTLISGGRGVAVSCCYSRCRLNMPGHALTK